MYQEVTLNGERISTQSLTGRIAIAGGTNDYNQLNNKPSINNVTLSGNKSLSDLGINIPTKTSELTNDSGYVTSAVTNNIIQAIQNAAACFSASSSIASFNTDIADKLYSCYVNVTAVQAGSGTPSPSNVRAISGWSACDLSVNSIVTTISFNQTVYGGVLDVLSGVLKVTHGIIDLGTLYWTVGGTAQTRYQTSDLSSVLKECSINETPNAICEVYQISTAADLTDKHITIFTSGGTTYIRAIDSDYVNDNTAFRNSLQNKYLVYELATPTTIQLTPTEVKTILGQNNIFADCGNIDLKYLETIGNLLT